MNIVSQPFGTSKPSPWRLKVAVLLHLAQVILGALVTSFMMSATVRPPTVGSKRKRPVDLEG